MGIVEHLGLVIQLIRDPYNHMGFSALFYPVRGTQQFLTHLPACLVLATASQDSLRSRRQLPRSGPVVVSYTKCTTREAAFSPLSPVLA